MTFVKFLNDVLELKAMSYAQRLKHYSHCFEFQQKSYILDLYRHTFGIGLQLKTVKSSFDNACLMILFYLSCGQFSRGRDECLHNFLVLIDY